MKFTQLLTYIVLAIIGFWLLGFVIELAEWVIEVALVVGLVLVVLWLTDKYVKGRRVHHRTKTKR